MADHLALDNIVSAIEYYLPEWSPSLERTRALRLQCNVTRRLWGGSHGRLWHACIRVSQAALAEALHVSPKWVGELTSRLVGQGWLRYFAPRGLDGKYEVGFYRPGPQLLRLYCKLRRAHGLRVHQNAVRRNSSGALKPLTENKINLGPLFSQLWTDLKTKQHPRPPGG